MAASRQTEFAYTPERASTQLSVHTLMHVCVKGTCTVRGVSKLLEAPGLCCITSLAATHSSTPELAWSYDCFALMRRLGANRHKAPTLRAPSPQLD